MNVANKAVANALQFECKKDGLKQLQSGEWTLSLKVHASDVPPALLVAPMGARYQAVIVEIGDDEEPVEQPKHENKHRLSQQAAMLCGDSLFQSFLANMFRITWDTWRAKYPKHTKTEIAALCVRQLCNVQSRAVFDTNEGAAFRWQNKKAEYDKWKLAL